MIADIFWFWELLGRLHPLIVHFPIGLLVVAFLFEIATLGNRRRGLRDGIRAMVWIGAVSALAAAVVGWLLARTGGYAGETLSYHQWTGLATAVLALATAWMLRKATASRKPSDWTRYRLVFALCLTGITVAGHLGATITHGEGYLTSALPWNQPESQAGELLAEFASLDQTDYQSTQLDRLNLEVRAIFAHKCYKCHSTEKHEGDLILDTQEGVFAGGESGPILIAGDARNSDIVRRINLPRTHDDAMPQKGKVLTPEEIELIERWIDLGAHWADRELKIFPEAPLALDKPELPNDADAFRNPIDAYVNAHFEKNRSSWPDPIDDRLFVRRAYLDIVGLLPTQDQVQAFVSNDQPNKRDVLIESLLDDTHAYTQHWLTFWNDLLRNDYSGTGYITGGRKQITDWLYDSLENNWSYDRMVRTLLNPKTNSEGFIRGIQWRGTANNSQRVEMQAAQNVSQALLGANLKCASCHNSFVSNITLDQAYGFASVFADSVLEVFRCDKPTGRYVDAAFLYPELGTIEGETVEERLVQLADVVVQPANGRLYRTFVNRIWDRLLGRGIVMPVDEMDNPPWSPELLDWLAADFIENGTDIKRLIAQIMSSQAYQLSTTPIASENDLLASSYEFASPARRRLSAEQFADAMSRILGPVYHGVAYDPFGEDIEAGWIWYHEQEVDRTILPKPGKRYFRHSFSIPSNQTIASAEVLIAVDHAFVLYVNGERLADGADWREVHRVDLLPALKMGNNLIAIEGENDGKLPNPAGVLFSLEIGFEDGSKQRVFSSDAWLTTRDAPSAGWMEPGFDDSAWKKARRYGRFNRSHWGRLLDFHHGEQTARLDFARASLVTLDPFLKALGRPTRENVTTRRDDQATLLQALELTNGEFYTTALHQGAEQWLRKHPNDTEALVSELYLSALGRTPADKELRAASALLGDQPSSEAVQDLLWAVFLLPEFQLIY